MHLPEYNFFLIAGLLNLTSNIVFRIPLIHDHHCKLQLQVIQCYHKKQSVKFVSCLQYLDRCSQNTCMRNDIMALLMTSSQSFNMEDHCCSVRGKQSCFYPSCTFFMYHFMPGQYGTQANKNFFFIPQRLIFQDSWKTCAVTCRLKPVSVDL